MQLPHLSFLLLVHDSTQPYGTCIGMQLEGFGKVSKGQDWGRVAQTLQCVKDFLAFLHPLNFSFLMGCIVARNLIVEGVSDFSITLNKASIVVCEP